MPAFLSMLLLILVANTTAAITVPAPDATSPTTRPDWSLKNCPPLTINSRTPVSQDGVQVEDLSFPGCDGKNISAFLVGPSVRKPGKHAAIVYVHWYAPNATNSNRNEFLEEAKRMAHKGVVSLLVSTFWSVPGGSYHQRRWQDDYDNTIIQTQNLLRAIAIISSLPEVDKKNIAYVGHDYGAVFGAIISGIDTEIKAFALVAGCSQITDWYLYGSQTGKPEGQARSTYLDSFKHLEPVTMLAKTKSDILLQYARNDAYISLQDAEVMHKAAPKNSQFTVYDTEHAMALPQIDRDRSQWLEKIFRR